MRIEFPAQDQVRLVATCVSDGFDLGATYVEFTKRGIAIESNAKLLGDVQIEVSVTFSAIYMGDYAEMHGHPPQTTPPNGE